MIGGGLPPILTHPGIGPWRRVINPAKEAGERTVVLPEGVFTELKPHQFNALKSAPCPPLGIEPKREVSLFFVLLRFHLPPAPRVQ